MTQPRRPRTSTTERERASRYVALATPPRRDFTHYTALGEKLLAAGGTLQLQDASRGWYTSVLVTRRRSSIFGQDYFIGWVPNEPFRATHPYTDAIAEIEWTPGRPPLVLAPIENRGNRSATFTAIIEHEIIHINQALVGLPRSTEKSPRPTTSVLLRRYFTHARLEFIAEYIQNARWRSTAINELGLTLEFWSLLRGHTQALEEILFDLLARRISCSTAVLQEFLSAVPRVVSRRLAALNLSREALAWFQERWRADVGQARLLVIAHTPQHVDRTPLKPVEQWIR